MCLNVMTPNNTICIYILNLKYIRAQLGRQSGFMVW